MFFRCRIVSAYHVVSNCQAQPGIYARSILVCCLKLGRMRKPAAFRCTALRKARISYVLYARDAEMQMEKCKPIQKLFSVFRVASGAESSKWVSRAISWHAATIYPIRGFCPFSRELTAPHSSLSRDQDASLQDCPPSPSNHLSFTPLALRPPFPRLNHPSLSYAASIHTSISLPTLSHTSHPPLFPIPSPTFILPSPPTSPTLLSPNVTAPVASLVCLTASRLLDH